jgi:hypothetical protein
LLSDIWFYRTWTYQEKLCSSSMELLISMYPYVNHSGYAAPKDDIAIELPSTMLIARTLQPGTYQTVAGAAKLAFLDTTDNVPVPRRMLPSKLQSIHSKMEKCENSVVSDRLAILANICNLKIAPKTTALNDARYSYSTCLISTVFANFWRDGTQRAMKYREFMPFLMTNTVGAALSQLSLQTSTNRLNADLASK